MTTTIINTPEELERFQYNGAFGLGALVTDAEGYRWLAGDTDDGVQCVRRPYEGEMSYGRQRQIAVEAVIDDLPLPLTITTEEN